MTHTRTSNDTLVYIVGAPGAGKTTLMAELTRNCSRSPADGAVPYDLLSIGNRHVAVEMGKHRPGFAGTDAMSMSIQPVAEKWIAGHPHPLVLGEGMRLANMKFFNAAADAGYTVKVVMIAIEESVLESQRAARGAQQNEQWLKGATSRARNLVGAITKQQRHALVILPHGSPRSMVSNLVAHVPELDVMW
jgi:ribose 1,5-bisphosphokinase PhnN